MQSDKKSTARHVTGVAAKAVILTEAPESDVKRQWTELLGCADFPSHYTSPEFFNEGYFQSNAPFAILACGDDGRIDGVLTGLRKAGGIVCGDVGSPNLAIRKAIDRHRVGRQLAIGLMRHAGSICRLITVYAWQENVGFEIEGFRVKPCSAPLGTVFLDLSKGSEGLFGDLSATRRHNIRRAIRAGVEVSVCDLDRDFDEYYGLYRDWCSYKGLPAQSYEAQRSAFAATENRLVLVARQHDRVIGVSTFRFRHPGMIEYASNVSRRTESKVRQNDLLVWRAIEWAAARSGFDRFSMGGAHEFSQKFGGMLYTTYRYRVDRTLLRRYDAKEMVHALAVRTFHGLPPSLRDVIRRRVGSGRGVN